MKMNRARLLSKESAIDTLWAHNNFDCPRGCGERWPQGGKCPALQFRERSRGKLRSDNQVTRKETGNARLDAKVGAGVNQASGWLLRFVRCFCHLMVSVE